VRAPLLLTNATLVLPGEVIRGTLSAEDGRIAAIGAGASSAAGAVDLEGDYILPGAIDVHTDNLERQVQPRSGTRWPSRSAFLAHDAQCAAAGITTVLDSLCVGDLGFDEDRPRTCVEGAADMAALAPTGLLRAEHYLHLRCELPAAGMLDQLAALADHPLLRMVSLMDHTPGFGQYADVERYRAMRLRDGDAADSIDARIAALHAQRARELGPNRAGLLAMMRNRFCVVASHDDRDAEDVAANLRDGIPVAEFPVTLEAAVAARRGGQVVVAGAPNLVRGFSHTGNVSVAALLAADTVDALASDYVPCSLIEAAFIAHARLGWDLPRAVALVTAAPARLAGFTDRGALAVGLRADLVRVRLHDGAPVVRAAWRGGERVA
jgi:alpha-D-ribose 1-methylphosphonate 5-triphosphate diphosphatase